MYDVFLSHASVNNAWVEKLARNLRGQGLKVFYDDWVIPAGAELVDALYDGLQTSRTGVLVVSPEAANSGWVGREYKRMLARRAKDPEYVIIPVVYDEVAEFPFIEDILWVDFRPDYRRGFHKLLCGLNRQAPGDGRFEGDLEIPGTEAQTSLEDSASDFLDDIIISLQHNPIQLLLGQDGRAGGPVIQALLERARRYFGAEHVWRLTPPIDPQAHSKAYFKFLGASISADSSIKDATTFEAVLQRRLQADQPLFVLVHGFENGSEACRRELASLLRNHSEMNSQILRVLLLGGEKLVSLKYAEGGLSLLNVAADQRWPELTVTDVQTLHPTATLSAADAAQVLFSVAVSRICCGTVSSMACWPIVRSGCAVLSCTSFSRRFCAMMGK